MEKRPVKDPRSLAQKKLFASCSLNFARTVKSNGFEDRGVIVGRMENLIETLRDAKVEIGPTTRTTSEDQRLGFDQTISLQQLQMALRDKETWRSTLEGKATGKSLKSAKFGRQNSKMVHVTSERS